MNTDKRERKNVYLSLGSNMGNRKLNLEKAIDLLEKEFGQATAVSSIYRTEAWGSVSLDWFYNQVIRFSTDKKTNGILEACLSIESKLGRERKNAKTYENRVIDIDVLLVGELVRDEKELQLPHPRLHLRNFVLAPLAELVPDIVHPKLKKTIAQLKKMCKDGNLTEKIE